MLAQVREHYRLQHRCEWFGPLGFDNSFVLVILKETPSARRSTRSAPPRRTSPAGPWPRRPAFRNSRTALPLLMRRYRLHLSAPLRSVRASQIYTSLTQSQATLVAGNATDVALSNPEFVTLDDAGPTAAVQCPYPRDFRQGVYKYTSTTVGAKPVWEDLERSLRRGIPGTAMLSFDELPAGHIDALVEYVKYLSIRGETELALLGAAIDAEEDVPDCETMIRQWVLPAASSWTAAKSMAIVPPAAPPVDTPEQLAASVAKGHALFVTKDAQCVKCHGADGKGDGEQSELYDDWNKCKKGVTPEQTAELARLYWLPIQELPARNLTEGVFHGGSRPVDLYWRVSAGIKGTPMPAACAVSGDHSALSPDDIWHVVNYIRSLHSSRAVSPR